MTLNSRQSSLRSAFQPLQRLVGTEKWFQVRNPKKPSNATSNESLPNSFRKGLSLAKSLQKYQQRGKLLQWQVHLNLKDWRRWFHGFIGEGSRRHGIWSASYKAWFEVHEDVVTFPVDLTMTKKAEDHSCDLFKAVFHKHAEYSGAMTIPRKSGHTEFYVNFKTSIFG